MDKQVGFRLPGALIDRIDKYAAVREAEIGLEITRTDAARMLLTAALDAFDREVESKPKPKKN